MYNSNFRYNNNLKIPRFACPTQIMKVEIYIKFSPTDNLQKFRFDYLNNLQLRPYVKYFLEHHPLNTDEGKKDKVIHSILSLNIPKTK